jgi:catalase-peroxidase
LLVILFQYIQSHCSNTEFLAPRNYSNPTVEVKDTMLILGLTAREMVALAGGLRSPSQQKALGYSGSWNDADPSKLDNSYYTILLKHTWTNTTSAAGKAEAKSEDGMFYMMPTDLVYRFDPVFSAIVVVSWLSLQC